MPTARIYADRRRTAVETELLIASQALGSGKAAAAFKHLERAHVLSQPHTRLHVRTHWAMWQWAWDQKDTRELVGQTVRILAAAVFSRIWVPLGNTGGARVSATTPMKIPPDLADLLKSFDAD